MRVAIVGPGGFVGRNLVQALAKQGASVVALSSQDSSGLDAATGALPENLRLDGVGSVVYLAQSPHGRQMPERAAHMFRVNVVSAIETAELARRCGARRFVYTSTGNVYLPSFQPLAEDYPVGRQDAYSLSKLHGEQALGLFREHMDVHVLRLFGVYGPGQTGRLVPTLLSAVREGRPVFVERSRNDPDDFGGLRISLSYIDDVVRAIIHLCQHGGPDLLNIAGDEVVSVRSVAEAIGAELRLQPIIEVADRFRDGNLVADSGRLKAFHDAPFTPFAEGLRRTLDFRNAG